MSIKDWISKEQSKIMKFFLALLIIAHHIYFYNQNLLLLKPFKYVGFLATGMFFFLSGYGLYIKKEKLTIHNYFKRIAKILIPFAIAICVYSASVYFFNVSLGTKNIFLIVSYSWYIYVLLILYTLYYVLFNKCERNFELIVCILLLSFAAYKCGLLDSWWKSNLAFSYGVIFAKYKTFFYKLFIDKKYIVFFASILFLGILLAMNKFLELGAIEVLTYNIGVLLFCNILCLSLLFIKTKHSLKVIEISYEMYLYHGLVLHLQHFNNSYLKVLESLVIIVITSYVFSAVNSCINKVIFNRKKCLKWQKKN